MGARWGEIATGPAACKRIQHCAAAGTSAGAAAPRFTAALTVSSHLPGTCLVAFEVLCDLRSGAC